MRKAVFGLIVLLVFGFVTCDNGANGNTGGVYSGYGVWLISQTDYDAYDAYNGSKQPTPTAMGMTSTIDNEFSVNFYNPYNYNTAEDPGWAIVNPNVPWTAVSGDYYVLIVPMYFPGGVAGQGDFWWMFDEGKISGSDSTPSKKAISANDVEFYLTDFINISDI
jgi:hypothetical protein